MKRGMIGDKRMSLMPKWLDGILNILFVLFTFIMVFTIMWVFYVLLQITHI